MRNFEIKNAFLVDPYIGSAKKRDIWIIDGKIRYKKPTKSVKLELIEATGCVILPGLTDLRCHLGKGGEDTRKKHRKFMQGRNCRWLHQKSLLCRTLVHS